MTSRFHSMGRMGQNKAWRYISTKFTMWRHSWTSDNYCLVEFIRICGTWVAERSLLRCASLRSVEDDERPLQANTIQSVDEWVNFDQSVTEVTSRTHILRSSIDHFAFSISKPKRRKPTIRSRGPTANRRFAPLWFADRKCYCMGMLRYVHMRNFTGPKPHRVSLELDIQYYACQSLACSRQQACQKQLNWISVYGLGLVGYSFPRQYDANQGKLIC